jgi:hypothetical protein
MLKVIILPLVILLHPIHVTLTTIDQAQGADTLKVHFRMYYDDFLRDYQLYEGENNPEKVTANDTFPAGPANKYFNNRVHIYVNNKLLTGEIQTITIQDNEIFLNLFYRSSSDPKKIKIMNKILTALYSDQTNMIFIKLNKNEQAMRLTPEHDKETWSIDR